MGNRSEAEQEARDHHCGGAWRAEVRSRILELTGRLTMVRCQTPKTKGRLTVVGCKGFKSQHTAMPTTAGIDAAKACIDEAETASRNRSGLLCGLGAWWTGSALTESWEAIHNAELSLIAVESEGAVQTAQPRILAWVQSAMDNGNRRSYNEKALKRQLGERAKFDRGATLRALADVIDANRKRYANLRAFRNTLILVTVLLSLLVAGIAGWHALNPNFLSLCSFGDESVCPAGSEAQRVDVALVAIVGALGGFLALAFGLAQAETAPSRYDPKAWQAFLKPVTGAATAVAGVLLLQAGFLVEPREESSPSIILVYALIFGLSQQLLTHVVDKRAQSIIDPDGSKHA